MPLPEIFDILAALQNAGYKIIRAGLHFKVTNPITGMSSYMTRLEVQQTYEKVNQVIL